MSRRREREDVQRAVHLARVCAGLPTVISPAGAARLARLLGRGSDPDG